MTRMLPILLIILREPATIDVLNAITTPITLVDSVKGVYVRFAVNQRETSKGLGGARNVSKTKVVFSRC